MCIKEKTENVERVKIVKWQSGCCEVLGEFILVGVDSFKEFRQSRCEFFEIPLHIFAFLDLIDINLGIVNHKRLLDVRMLIILRDLKS